MFQRGYIQAITVFVITAIVSSCSVTASKQPLTDRLCVLPVHMVGSHTSMQGAESSDTLRLVTLNLAHGRHDSFHQLLLSEDQIRQNIDETAHYIKALKADLVALQEADGPSWWSGNFDHVERLAKKSEFNYYIRAENVNNMLGDYGSAVLSQLPINNALGVVFQPSPPTSNKGFSVAQVQWQPADSDEPLLIDVVSVHLDFTRDSVRQDQIHELRAVLAPRAREAGNSIIIMGDFNSEWLAREYMLEKFAKDSKLHVFEADSDALNTYGSKRLDWILMTKDLEFIRYRVDDAKLSDHRVVIADIKKATQQ